MPALATELRNKLERTVVEARDVAEASARAALEALAIHHHDPYPHQTPEQRKLRNHLRARARQLGDTQTPKGGLTINHLAHECAYEHWHRMLFARFLAGNDLLIEPSSGVAISLQECEELAKEAKTDLWTYASRCAQQMLPQIFRPDDPLLQVTLAREHRVKLEHLLAGLDPFIFKADDALGWVYQFWQSKKKDEVNASGEKITGDTLPAVTQLFTEHYMVLFLLHNTVGAWHASKVLASNPRLAEMATDEEELRRAVALSTGGGYNFDYLRFVKVDKVDAASSRVPPPTPPTWDTRLEAASTSPIGFLDREADLTNLAGNLPHWRQEGVTYFITFRTADSLPQDKLREWERERAAWIAAHPEPHDDATRREYCDKFPQRIQNWLDAGYGLCPLARPECAQVVTTALTHFDGERYDLDQFVVMPNHVHVLVTPRPGYVLSDILHSWKSYTANQINKLLNRQGSLWQKESFDHIVRSPEQVERIRQYIRDNPRNARLEAASCRLPDTRNTRQDAASTWRPAAGTFDGWPTRAAELKLLDPCGGSGHFLVAGFELLVRLRMHEDGLSLADAVDTVLRDNLFGLELDARCTQIAAFNLALAAWRLVGFRKLPPLNIACTGIAPNAKKEDWLALSGNNTRLRAGMEQLYQLFQKAPVLGSLINPRALGGDLLVAEFHELQPLLDQALKREETDDTHEMAVTAKGVAEAAEILASKFTLVATNVPYLGRGKQDNVLRDYSERVYPEAKADLATCFVERCLDFCAPGGSFALVTPQSWLFQANYRRLRETLLGGARWEYLARLGARAFETISGEVVNVSLLCITRSKPQRGHELLGLDVEEYESASGKANGLRTEGLQRVSQQTQLSNPDAKVVFNANTMATTLEAYAETYKGICSGDGERFQCYFWEVGSVADRREWAFQQSTVDATSEFGGREGIFLWENGDGSFYASVVMRLGKTGTSAWIRGREAWGRLGVVVRIMKHLPVTRYTGEIYDNNVAVVIPKSSQHLSAIWAFCASESFNVQVRKLNQKLSVTDESFVQVPFDIAHWQRVAAEKYPHGLPKPHSDDPTQWLFAGHPRGAEQPLQVAVARLLGYRWPRQTGSSFPDSPGLGSDGLEPYADTDGIVCIPSVRGEEPAADRLLALLTACGIRPDRDLDDWLRSSFFEEHCKLFHHRPFIWHIWDGRRRDGFHVLVNYHKLAEGAGKGRKLLESLTYSYLGEWISRHQDGVKRGEDGAEDRLAAALELHKRLVAILEGEPPFDLVVRWKPLHQQPIGWEPDINDGVRINIRPFMASDVPNGRAGAGLLRWRPNIKWEKDRGKEPQRPKADFPWFWGWDGIAVDFMGGKEFTGDRFNDLHYSLDVKQQARARNLKGEKAER